MNHAHKPKMAFHDNPYFQQAVECDYCEKHLTAAQLRYFEAVIGWDEDGRVWCGTRCHDLWRDSRRGSRFRRQEGLGEPPMTAHERDMQVWNETRGLR